MAKLGATPAWLFLCSAFTIIAFLIIYWVADVYGKSKWFDLIKPAGTATILCYLVPYFVYSVREIFQIHLPEALVTGGIGLVKSFLFAMLCVFITGHSDKARGKDETLIIPDKQPDKYFNHYGTAKMKAGRSADEKC